MKYEYTSFGFTPPIPNDRKSVFIDDIDVANWLNKHAANGWEFVGQIQKIWHTEEGIKPQFYCIFKREKKPDTKAGLTEKEL
jgi:hypothetical protein